MRAAVIHNFEGIENISIEEVPKPQCLDNEVQIQVKYAGVNPVDWKIAEGLLQSRMSYEFPITLGWDVSGFVSQVGKHVKKLKEGDAIFAYCRKETMHSGSFAEFICLDHQNVILKPQKLSLAEAASIPLSALTAWQALFDTAKIKKNDVVLIHAGAGGVGTFAIQLAKMTGARVVTTASQANFNYVKQLGADDIIDYTKENFVEAIRKKYPTGVEMAFDTIGGATLKSTYEIVKKGGCLVTIAGMIDQALASQHHVRAEFVFVRPNGAELQKIAELFDASILIPPKIQEIPFQEVVSALRKSREGHTQGKLVLKMP